MLELRKQLDLLGEESNVELYCKLLGEPLVSELPPPSFDDPPNPKAYHSTE